MNSKNTKTKKLSEDLIEVIPNTLPGDKSIRRRRTRLASLKRTLGIPEIFSIAYGNLGSSIYYALGVTAIYAMGATPFVFMLAALFFVFTAASYAEGTAAIPEAGGSSSFARKGFNELVSFIAGWCLLLGYIVTISIASFAAIGYLGYLDYFSILRDSPWNVIATGTLLLFLMIVNVVGVSGSVVISKIFSYVDIATQAFLVIMGLFLFLNLPDMISRIRWGVIPTWNQLIMSFYIVMISFTGIETISNLAEESKEPGTTIPQSIWWSMGTIIITFFLVSLTALSAMPVEYKIDGYVYAVPVQYNQSLQDDSTLNTDTLIMQVEKEKVQKPNWESVPGAIIRVAQLSKDSRGEPKEWRVNTDKAGYFEIDGLGMGEYSFKIFKKPYQDVEFDFDTSKPETVPFNGEWKTDLVLRWKNDPVAGISESVSEKLPLLKHPLQIWVSLLAFTILIIATNAGILGVSRLIFSMGTYHQVPQILARVNKKTRTPYIAIIVFSVIAFLIVLPADMEKLAQVYAFSALISYTIAHASIIAMRVKFPQMERPYKIPFNIVIKGNEIPLSSIIGGIVCFTIWIIVAYKLDYGRNVGLSFLASGLLIYWLYRKRKGMSLTQTVEINKDHHLKTHD